MRYSEVLHTLTKYTGIEYKQSQLCQMLNISRGTMSARYKNDSEFLLEELIELEKALALPSGSLAGIQTDESSVELDYISIAPSCGRGTVVLDEADVTPVRIGKEVIKDIWKVSTPEVLKLFKASGDSMETTIEDGNILLVDTSRTDYHNGGIYVLTINNDWFVKRLRLKINGDLEIISDNPKYEPEVLRPNTDIEINVVGRVIKNLSRGL